MYSNAQVLRERGNDQFKRGKYSTAEAYYTEAITHDSGNPLIYTNRAFARLKLKRWQDAQSDCEAALRLEPQNMKALYYLAQAQLGLEQPEDALASALSAYEVCLASESSSASNVAALVLRAKKERWQMKEQERKKLQKSLVTELEDLLHNRLAEEREELRQRLDSERMHPDEVTAELEKLETSSRHKRDELRSVFAISDSSEQAQVVPDYLVDSITFNIMHDPVMTNTGRSYERSSILAHLKQSETDPLTRGPLTAKDLRPNLALREACAEFLDKNGWAADF